MNNIFTSYKTEEEAQRCADYINDQFIMFTHMPLKLKENTGENYHSHWLLVMTDGCVEYKKTVMEAKSAVNDFRRGYALGLAVK